jgi:hypothetical protein
MVLVGFSKFPQESSEKHMAASCKKALKVTLFWTLQRQKHAKYGK